MSTNNPVILNMNLDTIKNIVLTNLVKMIGYRKWIKDSNISKITEDIISIDNDNLIYSIKLDVDLATFVMADFTEDLNEIDDGIIELLSDDAKKEKKKPVESVSKNATKNFDGTKIYVKLFPQQKITSIEKTPSLNEFIKKYDKFHRIVIVDSITEKPLNKLNEYSNIELFNESFLMINLTDHVLSPQYNVLSTSMIEQFKHDYKILNLHYLPIMYDTDPVAKYLYVKKGQIIRIIRRTKNTEESIGYRVIAKKGNAKI